MSHTYAHRPHVHVRLPHVSRTPIIVMLIAAAAVVGVIALIDRLATTTETQVTGATITTAVGAGPISKPESLAIRRMVEAQAPSVEPKPVTRSYDFNHVEGAMLGPWSITVNPMVVPVTGAAAVAASTAALRGGGGRMRLHERYGPAD